MHLRPLSLDNDLLELFYVRNLRHDFLDAFGGFRGAPYLHRELGHQEVKTAHGLVCTVVFALLQDGTMDGRLSPLGAVESDICGEDGRVGINVHEVRRRFA